MKKIYFTLREVGNDECPNMGTVSAMIKGAIIVNDITSGLSVKEAIESHMDAEVIDMSSVDLTQAYNACPVEFKVTINNNGEEQKIKIEAEQTWLYS